MANVALLYRRAGFGLRPDELAAAADAGYQASVEQLLAGLGAAPDPAGDAVGVPDFAPLPADRKARAAAERAQLEALQRWWMDRMIVTATPLREKLALFWHGHFATAAAKVRDAKLMYLQNQLFRTAGAGSFADLTQGVARDGAMIYWLDTETDAKAHPNENFARELMELFTLGLGQYTQDDVTAAARAFTGWSYNRLAYRYVFRSFEHDYGPKTYLGQTGTWDGDDIVRLATAEPASARFVLAKLWSHFAYPVAPSDPVVGDLLAAYNPGLDITSALRATFLHPAFVAPATTAGLVKQPIEYLVGAARALGLRAAAPAGPASERRSLPALATALGQAPFNPPNVGGWGQNAYWLDTATAQLRLEIALLLAARADLSAVEAAPAAQQAGEVARLLGLRGWGPTTGAALQSVAGRPVQLTALALASPEYVLA